jgi:hypothetical protein
VRIELKVISTNHIVCTSKKAYRAICHGIMYVKLQITKHIMPKFTTATATRRGGGREGGLTIDFNKKFYFGCPSYLIFLGFHITRRPLWRPLEVLAGLGVQLMTLLFSLTIFPTFLTAFILKGQGHGIIIVLK